MIGFNVAQILKFPTGTTRQVDVNEFDQLLAEYLRLVSPSMGSLRLMRTGAGILVRGTISHRMEVTCSRCLETFERDQTIEFDDEFLSVVDVNTGLPVADGGDPDAFKLTSGHLLCLDEAIRQYSLLESPLQPLCSADCRGLCIECGANLNLGPCGCEPTAEVAPAATLGALLAERLRWAGFKSEQE